MILARAPRALRPRRLAARDDHEAEKFDGPGTHGSTGPLTEAIRAVLPTQEQTWLLGACLHSAQAGRDAWDACRERFGDLLTLFESDAWGARRLAPLLFAGLGRSGVSAHGRVATTLRTAHFREELRSRAFRNVLGSALSRLHAAGIPAVVVKGAAAAETVYPDPALRHTCGIDILVDADLLGRAVDRLDAAGWTRKEAAAPSSGRRDRSDAPWPGRRGRAAEVLVHASGVPLRLSSKLFQGPYYDLPLDELRSRSEVRILAGAPARVLSCPDALVEICGQAPGYGPDGLLWVCDACFLLERHPQFDWDAFLAAALRARVAVPVSATLEYLAREFGAPVPRRVLQNLHGAAVRVDRPGRDAALLWARSGAQSYRALFSRVPGWASRLRITSWLLFPSAAHMRQAYGGRSGILLACGYLRRMARFLAWHAAVPLRRARERLPCA